MNESKRNHALIVEAVAPSSEICTVCAQGYMTDRCDECGIDRESARAAAPAPQPDVSARDAALEEAAVEVEGLKIPAKYRTYFEINEYLQQAADAIRELKAAAPESAEPSAEPIANWYESMRRTLIGQVHELIDIAERSTWRKDDEDEVKRTEGAIAHARKVSSVYNYNGDGTTQRTQVLATSSAAKGAA
jgi:hypothetical protein